MSHTLGTRGSKMRDDDELARLARELAPPLRAELGEHPSREQLEASTDFRDAVERIKAHVAERTPPIKTLTLLALAGDRWVSRLILPVLAGREDLPAHWASTAVRRLKQAPLDQAWLFLRTLEGVSDPVIGQVLAQLEYVSDRDVAELIAARLAAGRETVDEDTFGSPVTSEHAELIESMLDETEHLIPFFRKPFEEWLAGLVDIDFLSQFARIWARPFASPPALLTPARRALVDAIHEAMTAQPAEALVLIGEHGVGKTSLVRAALDRLPARWVVFEATASAVHAGAVYVGELETRVASIVRNLKGRSIVWVLPALEETLYAGRHSQSPTGLLDHLLPHLQAGELHVVAETSPAGFEAIIAQRPNAATAFQALRVRPLGEEDSIAVANHALTTHRLSVAASDDVLAETFELAQQFLPGAAPPGNLIRLLGRTAEDVVDRGESEIETADVLSTLARMSGLPLALLDPNAPLDLDEARRFVESRVLGQPEAVDCLVERIALIKSGLTDPTRPLGVFLFVGPTGTGKTEIAKVLAELLFGSPSRLIRLDMSEYQTYDSLERLISDTTLEPQGAPLISSVRKDPFSVVLLDEFEKADTAIWDLFLQVFDDGRLTDSHGRVVDFRRCVIIMTSNVGSSIVRGPGVGFAPTEEPFRPQAVERAVRSAFRPEFLNRLDRVVVFRPFERAQMRALLEKELADASKRRGLRRRPWAVEYDESALDFLIERGFTPELGARPLKRSVERYLLAPLAKAIVAQAVPEGEQFLFITAPAGEIEVRFVDPDAEEEAPLPEGPGELDLRTLTLTPGSHEQASAFLLGELRRIEDRAETEGVGRRKERALRAASEPGFWDEEGRFAVLAEAEYLDRFEAALRTARKLGERLERRPDGRGAGEVVGLLAARLYVLDQALDGLLGGAAFDVFLRLRPGSESDPDQAAPFVELLERMYRGWCERRGMRLSPVASDGSGQRLYAVSGLGAGQILPPEAGLHVIERESGKEAHPLERTAVAVEVAPWRAAAPAPLAALRARAEESFQGLPMPSQVVRRYRLGPSPLVRDSVRGYRTGRLEQVLAGDFDVF